MAVVERRKDGLQILFQLVIALTTSEIMIARAGQAVHVVMPSAGFGKDWVRVFQHVRKEQKITLVGVPVAIEFAVFHFGIGQGVVGIFLS